MQPSVEHSYTSSITDNIQLSETPPPPEPHAKDNGTNVSDMERVISAMLGGALLLTSLRAPTPRKAAQLVGGAALLHRGLTGHCYMYQALDRSTAHDRSQRSAVERTITISKPADELHRAWRDPKHVAAIMAHIARVENAGGGRFRWTAPLLGKRKLTWTTSVVEDRPGELLAWRTQADAPFTHEGAVRFRKAPDNLGTEVTLRMTFGAQDSVLRKVTEKYLRTLPRVLEESILRRCKSLCEAGEIPTLERNPSARETITNHATQGTPAPLPLERSLS